jgi:hypothetical protein
MKLRKINCEGAKNAKMFNGFLRALHLFAVQKAMYAIAI